MFGAGNEPTSVEEFYARIPQNIDLYAYNEGEIVDMNVEKVKSVGRNLCNNDAEILPYMQTTSPEIAKTWFEEGKFMQGVAYNGHTEATKGTATRKGNTFVVNGESGYGMAYMFKPIKGATYRVRYSGDALSNIFASFYDSNKRYISHIYNTTTPVIPHNDNIEWCVIVFSGQGTISNIDIRLDDSSKNGTYEPYISREQSLDIIGKYFPNGMKSAGTSHDEIRYNKATQKWEAVKRIGEVDMGTLSWSASFAETNIFIARYSGIKSFGYGSRNVNWICSKYLVQRSVSNDILVSDKYITQREYPENILGTIIVKDTSYTAAATFKSAMNGVMLCYELAEPIVTEIEEDINLDYEVWNGGTEQAIADTPSTPLKADIVYGFNAYGVIKDLREQVATMQTMMAQMQLAMASVTNSNSEEWQDESN